MKQDDTAKIDELAAMMKACGHPLRLRILCAIQLGEDTCVSELWNCLEQSQPVVSQHLAVLKRRGIVGIQAGLTKHFKLNTYGLTKAKVERVANAFLEIAKDQGLAVG